jgi:hypothetical protein
MLNLKRFILVFLAVLCSVNMVFADSYIMISDTPIKEIKCQNESVVQIRALTTLSNEKTSFIVSACNDGKTSFTIKNKSGCYDYAAKVRRGKLEINGDSQIKIIPIDLPQEMTPAKENN